MKVFIGYDQREAEAYRVAKKSLLANCSAADVVKLDSDRLAAYGLLRRATDRRGGIYDLPSNAAAATDFHVSRFLVPHLAQEGWALFVDCDVVFLRDPTQLLALVDPEYAAMVVKHPPIACAGSKMDGQEQRPYPRKNWSSVMLWNCDHPSNRRLSLHDVNERPGRDLHAMYWLHDSEIGELPAEWNWLVGLQPKPSEPRIAHFTQGGPWLPGWKGSQHDHIWTEHANGP